MHAVRVQKELSSLEEEANLPIEEVIRRMKERAEQESEDDEDEEEEFDEGEEEDEDEDEDDEDDEDEDEEEEDEEDEDEEEEVAQEEEEEDEDEEEEEEVFMIEVSGVNYYTNDDNNGDIYSILEDDDIGEVVGNFKNGTPTIY